jgi:hypothetical protein
MRTGTPGRFVEHPSSLFRNFSEEPHYRYYRHTTIVLGNMHNLKFDRTIDTLWLSQCWRKQKTGNKMHMGKLKYATNGTSILIIAVNRSWKCK